MPIPFRYYLRVRYAECDAQKVVFNARYGDYVELATTEYMRALGFKEELVSGALDYQLVKQTLEWKSSARFDDVIEVQVTNAGMGTTSFTIRSEFRRAGEGQLLATGETVYVMVDSATLTKKPLPEHFCNQLAVGADGKAIDHAAYLRR